MVDVALQSNGHLLFWFLEGDEQVITSFEDVKMKTMEIIDIDIYVFKDIIFQTKDK